MVSEDGNKSDGGSQEEYYNDPTSTYGLYYRPWYHQPYQNKSQLNSTMNVDDLSLPNNNSNNNNNVNVKNNLNNSDNISLNSNNENHIINSSEQIKETTTDEENIKKIDDNNLLIKNNNDSGLSENKFFNYFGIHFKQPLKWVNVILITAYHVYFVYCFFYYLIYARNSFLTTVWAFIMGGICGFGVTGGVHRMWSHRSYKANLPLRIILMMCFSAAGQNSIYDWVRDHRIHHKYSETDADPHNSNRGFFFAHVGWLMMKKHPKVIEKGNQIDMSDVLNDPVVQFHEKYFVQLKLLLCFIIPTVVPMIFWNESFYVSLISQVFLRYICSLNFTWLVNSAAHIYGNRPYDKRINPVENLSVAIVAMGEGWHNYHHVFPWDYKAAELGNYRLNFTTAIIDFFSKLGWAYDLKEPSKDLIMRTILKHGDGSHDSINQHPHHHEEVPDPEFDENSNMIKKTK